MIQYITIQKTRESGNYAVNGIRPDEMMRVKEENR
jgi:hypothetical protein